MNNINRIIDGLDRLSGATGRLISWLTLAMVVTTFAVVLLRYLFSSGWIAMQESIGWMHAAVFMLGAAYTLREEGHVRVDIFYRKMGPRGRAWVDLLGFLLLLLPVCGFIFWISWAYVASAWAIAEGSREAGGLPGIYLLKSLLLLLPLLLLLQGCAQGLRAWRVLRGVNDDA